MEDDVLMYRQRACERTRRPRRLVCGLAVLAGALLPAAPAAAAEADEGTVLGPLAIAPESGDLDTRITMTTGGGCPRGTNSIVKIFGAGFPADGENVVGNTETIEFGSPPADRMVVPMTITIAEAVRRQAAPPVLAGEYRLELDCQEPIPPDDWPHFGVYVGHLSVDGAGRWTAATTPSDLPEPPTPQTGPDAAALVPLPAAPEGAPAAVAQPRAAGGGAPSGGEDATDAVRASASGTDADRPSDGSYPVAVGGGILLAGLAAAVGFSRRARETAGRRP
jgi:hypothetical protein